MHNLDKQNERLTWIAERFAAIRNDKSLTEAERIGQRQDVIAVLANRRMRCLGPPTLRVPRKRKLPKAVFVEPCAVTHEIATTAVVRGCAVQPGW